MSYSTVNGETSYFLRKGEDDLYLIMWHHKEYETNFVAITNDLDKWLEQNNAQRDDDNQETLEMFDIQQLETHLFDEEEK